MRGTKRKNRIKGLLLAGIFVFALPLSEVEAAEPPTYEVKCAITEQTGYYETNERKIMGHRRVSSKSIDIAAKYGDKWIQTTYALSGYEYVMANLGGCEIEPFVEFINDGRYMKLAYKVTAGEAAVTNGSLGVHADIMIGDNDYATIEIIQNRQGKAIGLKMVDDVHSSNSSNFEGTCTSHNAQYNLYFAGTGGVTNADTYWFGHYSQRKANWNIQISPATTSLKDTDSGMAISWQNINLRPEQSKTFSFILGVGEAAEPPEWGDEGNSPITLTIDAEQTGRTLKVAAKVKDEPGLTDIIYYNVDDGAEQEIGRVSANGKEQVIEGTIDLSDLEENRNYIFQFWGMNSKGAASEAVEKRIRISGGKIYGDVEKCPSIEDLDKEQAAQVREQIQAIPDPIEDDDACKNAIQAAREAYDNLSDEAKAHVLEYQKLVDAETAYEMAEDADRFPYWKENAEVIVAYDSDCPVLALDVTAQIRDMIGRTNRVNYRVEPDVAAVGDALLGTVTVEAIDRQVKGWIDISHYPVGSYTFTFWGDSLSGENAPGTLPKVTRTVVITESQLSGDIAGAPVDYTEENREGILCEPLTQRMVDAIFGVTPDENGNPISNATLSYHPEDGNENSGRVPATVTLNRDILRQEPILLGDDLILDLNGHKIAGVDGADADADSDATDGKPAIQIVDGGVTITIQNSNPDRTGYITGGDGGDSIDLENRQKAGNGGTAIFVGDDVKDANVVVKGNAIVSGGNGGAAWIDGNSGAGGRGVLEPAGHESDDPNAVQTGEAGALVQVRVDADKAGTPVTVDENVLWKAVKEELKTARPGEHMVIILSVEDKTKEQPDKDKVEAVVKGMDLAEVIAYYDITLTKHVEKNGTVTDTPIEKTEEPVTVSMEIPTDWQEGSGYQMIRAADGQVLKTTEMGNKIRFSTNQFSTHALSYVPETEPLEAEPPKKEPPKKEPPKEEQKQELAAEQEDPLKGLTEEQRQAVRAIAVALGVDEKTALEIYQYAQENGIPLETLLVTEEDILNQQDDNSITGSSFSLIQARIPKYGKNSLKIKWNRVKGADGYLIYGNKCGKKNHYQPITEVNSGSTTSYLSKKRKKGTYYKYIVRAYKKFGEKKITIAVSKTVHGVTLGGKYGVAKAVKVNKAKVTLKVGKTHKIKAKEMRANKKIRHHRNICYESSNDNIATVSSKGVVKGVGKGKCYVYVYAQNGVYKKVTVTVK